MCGPAVHEPQEACGAFLLVHLLFSAPVCSELRTLAAARSQQAVLLSHAVPRCDPAAAGVRALCRAGAQVDDLQGRSFVDPNPSARAQVDHLQGQRFADPYHSAGAQVDHLQGRLFVDRMEAATFIASTVLRGAPPGGLPMPLATGACACTHAL